MTTIRTGKLIVIACAIITSLFICAIADDVIYPGGMNLIKFDSSEIASMHTPEKFDSSEIASMHTPEKFNSSEIASMHTPEKFNSSEIASTHTPEKFNSSEIATMQSPVSTVPLPTGVTI